MSVKKWLMISLLFAVLALPACTLGSQNPAGRQVDEILSAGQRATETAGQEAAQAEPSRIATDTPQPSFTPENTPTNIPTNTPTNTPTEPPTQTPEPTETSTPDLAETAAYEATQAAEAAILEIEDILQITDLSTGTGSLLWLQPEPVEINLSSFSEWVHESFEGDPRAADFILYSEITWESSGGMAGCNLIFRSGPNFAEGPQYDLETIRLSGLPGWDIIFYDDSIVQKNVTGILTAGAINQMQRATNKILLIAQENKFTVYINGQRIGSYYDYANNLSEGLFAFEAWQETGETTCTFKNSWVWTLD